MYPYKHVVLLDSLALDCWCNVYQLVHGVLVHNVYQWCILIGVHMRIPISGYARTLMKGDTSSNRRKELEAYEPGATSQEVMIALRKATVSPSPESSKRKGEKNNGETN